MSEKVGTYAYRCGLCNGQPRYELEREGDVVVTWACEAHLALVLADLLPVDEHRNAARVRDMTNAWTPRS